MAPNRFSSILLAAKAVSKRLIASYWLDWIVLIILGIVAFAFTFVDPHFRPFSLLDLSISYPYIKESISVPVLAAACVLAPAIIIAGVVFLFVPGPAAWKRMSAGEIVRVKLWEFNVGWLGLALAHATQFLLVQGLKNLLGKPRPNLLDRCQPSLNNIQKHAVGGYGQDISPRWVLVDKTICTQSDRSLLTDGFRSFPSGHNSTAFAGMLYLSLYLASKFGVGFPVLPFHKRDTAGTSTDTRPPLQRPTNKSVSKDSRKVGYRDEAAAAPIWTILMVYVPMGVAIYIGSTRYYEYYHQGFDILSGSAIGLLCGWIGFRWYHGPLGRSAGWAWGPRSRDRAFGIGVGTLGYVTHPPSDVAVPEPNDVELGPFVAPPQFRGGRQREHYEALGSFEGSRHGPSR